MNRSSRGGVLLAMAMVWMVSSMPASAMGGKQAFVPSSRVQPSSNRLIVKLRPAKIMQGMSVPQIHAELSKPFSAPVVQALQIAAGATMLELRATSNGAHVMMLSGTNNRQAVAQALAGIRKLSNVEYVEEDRIHTIQTAPNDAYYTTGPSGNPGLWGMWPVTAAVLPSSGTTGSYGADFETAWNTSTGNGVVVAVVDTGITPHVDIVGPSAIVAAGTGSNLVSVGYDFITDCRIRATCAAATPTANSIVAPSPDATDLGDFITATDVKDNPDWVGATIGSSSWHGTHIAGIIAALGNNGIGVIGGAYHAKLLPVRVLGKDGGFTSDIAEGILWAADVHPTIRNPNPAKVINLSLGGTCATSPCTCPITEQNAINAAVAAGAVVVVSAGNDDLDVADMDPANCRNVISVAAIARDGSRASYSNFSSPASNSANPIHLTLAAPGSDQAYYLPSYDPGILSTLNTGTTTPVLNASGSNYVEYEGTSMATPHVAAAVALMLARNPALTPAQVKTLLSSPSSLTAFPSFGTILATYDCSLQHNCGAGILNAKLAVQNSTLPLVATGSFDFGAVVTGSKGNNKTVTFVNLSPNSVMTGTPALSGPDAALFNVVSDGCNGVSVAPGGSCQITMTYSPTTAGTHTATLTVADATVATVASLTGTTGTALTTPISAVSAATVMVGQSTTVDLAFDNPGTTAQPTGSITFSLPTIMATSADACSNVILAASASCSVTVTITPAIAGNYSGTVSLGLSGGGNDAQATVSGSATPRQSSGGGCSVMPIGATPDVSLLLALLAVTAYWLRRRTVRNGRAD